MHPVSPFIERRLRNSFGDVRRCVIRCLAGRSVLVDLRDAPRFALGWRERPLGWPVETPCEVKAVSDSTESNEVCLLISEITVPVVTFRTVDHV